MNTPGTSRSGDYSHLRATPSRPDQPRAVERASVGDDPAQSRRPSCRERNTRGEFQRVNQSNVTENEVSVCERVVETIAMRKSVGPTDLEPLYHTVDPQRLEALFPGSPVEGDPVRQFTFEYEDHVVTVSSGRSVEVAPADGRNPASFRRGPGVPAGCGEPETPD